MPTETTSVPFDGFYRQEYTKDFVSRWDDLIGWEGRADSENGFFTRLLRAHGVRTVADVASGTGFHAVNLARDGFDVTATDGAANMIRRTIDNAKRFGAHFADTRVVDWTALASEFGSDRFDALLCLGNAFTHIFDHETRRDALKAMYDVLTPGGVAIIDHRNYDDILDNGFSTKHKFYYTGENVDARPVEITRTLCKFEYSFPDGTSYNLHLYPLRQDYMSHLLEDAGFVDVTRYGDFQRPFDRYDVDFVQQIAFKPRR